MILETYAPESSCQSQIICKDLQHSSRSWTRRGGHSRSCHTRWSGRHTRWSGQRRRRTIVVSRWEWWWKAISWDRHAAITRHRRHRSPRWWGQTRRWHWLSRIHCHTTALCYAVAFSAHHCAIFWSRSTSVPSNSSFVSGC